MGDLSNHKAIILAGGKGTRLYPVTYEIPKPLLPVKRKPIINYLVDLFLKVGIKEIGVSINKDFEDEFNWWKKRYYPLTGSGRAPNIRIFQEEKPLGTLGGLFYLKDWVSNSPFFLTNGDELKEINLFKMAEYHQKFPVLATLALVKVPDPQNYGVVLCKNGLVEEFVEKPKIPPTKFINSGLYLLSPEVFNYHPGPKFSMFETDLFPQLAREKKLAGFKFNGKWMDTGTFQRYENALKHWQA